MRLLLPRACMWIHEYPCGQSNVQPPAHIKSAHFAPSALQLPAYASPPHLAAARILGLVPQQRDQRLHLSIHRPSVPAGREVEGRVFAGRWEQTSCEERGCARWQMPQVLGTRSVRTDCPTDGAGQGGGRAVLSNPCSRLLRSAGTQPPSNCTRIPTADNTLRGNKWRTNLGGRPPRYTYACTHALTPSNPQLRPLAPTPPHPLISGHTPVDHGQAAAGVDVVSPVPPIN